MNATADISDVFRRLERVLDATDVRDDVYQPDLVDAVNDVFASFSVEGGPTPRLGIRAYETVYAATGDDVSPRLQVRMHRVWEQLRQLWLKETFGSTDVWYKLDTDGGGVEYADLFARYLPDRFPQRSFFKAYEWCSGPGFIGFHLLQSGLAQYLTLSDISRQAMQCVDRTVRENRLGSRVNHYLSDNLRDIDAEERFDLVVGHPPWAYQVKEAGNPLIASDPEWQLHERFYNRIGDFLLPGAIVCLTCYAPFKTRPHAPHEEGVWDVRPEEPARAYERMIERGGLKMKEIVKTSLSSGMQMGDEVCLVISEYPG